MTVSGVEQGKEPTKLVLCFDGTGNSFTGSNADTNVVKILNKLDHRHPHQLQYYQTGVGTYNINEKSVHKTLLGEMRSSIFQIVDQALGTTFDSHVMAGYRFLMQYYEPGDKIYLFGFSRGAFTARFLARMVSTVGLLCKGNEGLVPFAYSLYQRYLVGEADDFEHTKSASKGASSADGDLEPLLNGDSSREGHGHTYELARNEVITFSNTFCRKEPRECSGYTVEENVKVYFLGMWDCVNSVAVLELNAPLPVPVEGTANFVRHAVAVDERRVKFKPALLAQDIRNSTDTTDDIKEVWFPGCHGDVGGGCAATEDDNLEDQRNTGFWRRFKSLWTALRPQEATRDVHGDPFQMSDVPLAWMIRELELVGELDPQAGVKWRNNASGCKRAFARETSQRQALKGSIHDSLRFGSGTGFLTVLFWKFMEILPIITRWELDDIRNQWVKIRFPLNKGSYRDIPRHAVLHKSLIDRLHNVPSYCPGNNHGGRLEPCLKNKDVVPDFQPVVEGKVVGLDDQTYVFPPANDSSEPTE